MLWYKGFWGALNYFIVVRIANALGFKDVAYGNKNPLPFLSLTKTVLIMIGLCAGTAETRARQLMSLPLSNC